MNKSWVKHFLNTYLLLGTGLSNGNGGGVSVATTFPQVGDDGDRRGKIGWGEGGTSNARLRR